MSTDADTVVENSPVPESEQLANTTAAGMDLNRVAEVNDEAQAIIGKQTLVSMGLGLIAFPIVDAALLLGQQLYMIQQLGKLYGQDFTHDVGQKAVTSLLAVMLPRTSLKYTAHSLLKMIPLIGSPVSMMTMPLLNGAATYAVGQVFNKHYATGGTLLSFDPVRYRAYFDKMFEAGRQFASEHRPASS